MPLESVVTGPCLSDLLGVVVKMIDVVSGGEFPGMTFQVAVSGK